MINATAIATYISRRPAWSGTTRVECDAIVYEWTAPTVPEVAESGGMFRSPVSLFRYDDLLIHEDRGVALHEGEALVHVLDTTMDVGNARLLAKALLECCNRYEDATYDEAAR